MTPEIYHWSMTLWVFAHFHSKVNVTKSPVGIKIFSERFPLYPLIWKVWIFISFDWITVYFCLRLNTSFVIVCAPSLANGWCICHSTGLVWSVDLIFPDKIEYFWGRFGMASHSSSNPTCVSAKVHRLSPLLKGQDSGGIAVISFAR